MALTWTMTLKDAMSGAASKAARAVDKLTSSLKGADRASSKTAANPYGGVVASAHRAGKAVDQLNAKMAKKQPSGGGSAMGGLGMAAGIAGVVGAMGVAAAGAGVAGTLELGGMIRDAQGFRNNTAFAFEQILGSKQAAADAMAMAGRTANLVGADLRESMGAMNTLMAQGFSVNFADEMVRAMADLKTINPTANLEGITRAVSQIKTTGRLQGDELMQLAEAGVNVSKVYEQIAKAKGLSDKKGGKTAAQQVQDLQAAGKISSDEAIAAIMGTIKNQVGGKEFGATAAAKIDGTLTGALIKANNMKEMFLSSINIDWSPLTRALDRVMAVMASPAGEKFSKAIGAGFDKMLGVFDSLSEKDIASMITMAGDAFGTFSGIMANTAKFMISCARATDWLNESLKSVSDGAVNVFDASWTVVKGILNAMTGGLYQVVESIYDNWGQITAFFSTAGESIAGAGEGIFAAASGLGSSIVDGIVSGISSGASAIADAAMTAARGALDSAKSFLGIKSPSKLFRDQVGAQLSRGMALGIQDGTPQVRDSSQRMGEQAFAGGQRLSSAITNNTSRNSSATAILNQQGGNDEEASNTIAIRALADQLRGMNAAAA